MSTKIKQKKKPSLLKMSDTAVERLKEHMIKMADILAQHPSKIEELPPYVGAPEPTDDDWITMQEILNAIISIPGMWDRIEAYMIRAGIDNPRETFERWRKIADA